MALSFRHLLFASALGSLPLSAHAVPVNSVVPADSFINQHVDTEAQLGQQITLDPVVRRRLARHFHTSGPAVVRYIQDNLVLKKLKTASTYQVYCISAAGREYTINSHLPAGTPVFVSKATGKPVLKLACGNPMMASLPPVTKISPSIEGMPQLASTPSTQSFVGTPALAPNGPVVVALNDVPGSVFTPVTKISPFLPTVFTKGGGGGFPLGFLAGIPVLAGIIGHGGGGGNSPTGTTGTTGSTGETGTTGGSTGGSVNGNSGTGTNTGSGTTTGTGSTGGSGGGLGTNNTGGGTTGTNTGTTPVPEPATPVAFLIGAGGLLLLMGRVRRRTRLN